ncbi:MAG: STAS-like domain-containing protein [Aestuariivita sp.]|nr:STAS-like domain-containing protein [Aestuariivita sp.]MCY4347181.1 STAS-like domain-containing protein [Aestuariivita sp.]
MAEDTTIDVANEFNRWPAGRFRRDGRYSGERFREELLVPALKKQGTVTIEMDGAAGYGPSFLEEAFGGLIRKEGFGKNVLSRLNIETNRNNRKMLIREAIQNAIPEAVGN